MNRRRLLMIAGVLVSFYTQVEAQVKFNLSGPQTGFDLEVSEGKITGHAGISHFYVDLHTISGKTFIRLSLPGAFVAGEPGMPGLPVFSKLVEADTANSYQLTIAALDSTVINMEEAFSSCWILPVQPPAIKNQAGIPDTIVDISPEYLAFGQEALPLAGISHEGHMRGIQLARVQFSPFRYDPEQKKLTVYHEVAFSLIPEHYSGSAGGLRSARFRRSMSGVVMDDGRGELKRIVQDEPVTMVMLSDTTFRDALQPLVEWKKLKGFRVIEAYTTDPQVGNTAASIREFMSGLYHDPPPGMTPPSYLLIAGDVEHVPVSQPVGQVTDLYYTTFDGPEDYLPEMFHGRISVKNELQLTHVINKILMYERYEFPDPSFLDRSILIAGYDASYAPVHGNGQINYAASYYFNDSKGINAKVHLHPQAATLDAEIRQEISLGAALVNYTGHGEHYGWLDPALRMEHIDEMENQYRFGLMIGNGCSTNQFSRTDGDCFAEAILKLENRGAIGYIGCTNDSYWDEDFYWSVGVGLITSDPLYEATTHGYYDKLFHLGDEAVEDWSPSLGEMIFAGNMTVQQSTSARKKYYWEIYQVMGDPSLVPWFTTPGNEAVTHPSLVPATARNISVQASPYDYVAVSSGGELLHAAHTDMSGMVYLRLPETDQPGELVLVVTGDLRQPYIDTIMRGSPANGYLELTGYQLANESVEQDGIISPGENFSLDLQILNSSDNVVLPGSLVLDCASGFMEIQNPVVSTGVVQPGETVTLNGVFRIRLKGAPANMTSFTFSLERADDISSNRMFLGESVRAPLLSSSGVRWEDRSYGNGNGIPEPGEQLLFSWDMRNDGGYRSDSVSLQLTDMSGALFNTFQPLTFGTIPAGAAKTFQLAAKLDEHAGSEAVTRLPFSATDKRYAVSDTLTFVPGSHLEDFSTGDLSRFHWMNGSAGWIADSSTFSGGPYSMRSGTISHSQATSLKIEVRLPQDDTISFRYRVSSEKGYDFLSFFIDGVLVKRWSGYVDWKQGSFPIDSGQHVLEWRYDKDSNTTRGEDAAWIDDVVFPPGVFTARDVGILKPLHPLNSRSLGAGEPISVLVINTGKDTIQHFTLAYKSGEGDWSEITFNEILVPGQMAELTLPAALDLSGFATYNFSVSADAGGDTYPGNNTMNWAASHYMFPDIAVGMLGIDSLASEVVHLDLEIENLGNIPAETLYYHLYLNEHVKRDSVDVLLEPGESRQIAVTLIDTGMGLGEGWYDYLFVADADSVPGNNSVEGTVYWNVLSVEREEQENFRIFPNPVMNQFTILIPGALRQPSHIAFFDLNGRLVYRDAFSGTQKTYRAGEVFSREGMYVLRVTVAGGKILYSVKVRVEQFPGK
ncbi:MAG: C25 family cysteine peptidase [Bacteroidales bacterium]|nr:C25 family cysteine peptidase [Bacteroidales bacterium]